MSKSHPRPKSPGRTRAVVVLECEADNMHSAWIDRITVERRGWGDFRVVTRRQLLDERRPRSLGDEAGIAGPDALAAKLEAVSEELDGEPDWATVVDAVAVLDWATAAVMATRREESIPVLPSPAVLSAQRSQRWLGRVRLAAEWGYSLHDLYVPFLDWVRILQGTPMEFWTRYVYEGERFVAHWSFNDEAEGPGSLSVVPAHAGVGWCGPFRVLTVIQGREFDGVDLAAVAVEACPGEGSSSEALTPPVAE
jgi:hypothetical protein